MTMLLAEKPSISVQSKNSQPTPLSISLVVPYLYAKPVAISRGVIALADQLGNWSEISGVDQRTLTFLQTIDGHTNCERLMKNFPLPQMTDISKLLRHLIELGLVGTKNISEQPLTIGVLGEGLVAERLRLHFPGNDVWNSDFVIVASEYIEPDRGQISKLRREGKSYLIVSAHQNWARLGPLAIAGHPGGICCLDHGYCQENDDYWLVLLALGSTLAKPSHWAIDWLTSNSLLAIKWFGRKQLSVLSNTVICASHDQAGFSRFSWPTHQRCCINDAVYSHQQYAS